MSLAIVTAERGYGTQRADDLFLATRETPEGTEQVHKWAGPHPGTDVVCKPAEATAFAVVRQDRWVVLCPSCPNAMYAPYLDRRFFCTLCRNAAVGGRWIPVEWPEHPEEIELHLLKRVDPFTRNWEWGEEVANLVSENFEHGASSLLRP